MDVGQPDPQQQMLEEGVRSESLKGRLVGRALGIMPFGTCDSHRITGVHHAAPASTSGWGLVGLGIRG